jgi:hypothetical protein
MKMLINNATEHSKILKKGVRRPDIRHNFTKTDKINATELETSV